MAGVLQLDPRPFTLRELRVMYRSSQIEQWDRIAMLTIVHCGKNTHPYDLNPYRKPRDSYGSRAIEAEYNALKDKGATHG